MAASPLAALRFDHGADVDAVLAAAADALRLRGLRVCGVLQSRGAETGECACRDMDLSVIGAERAFRISQPLGQGSAGCRLNPGALAECAAFLEGEVARGVDLLILNRFGRGESEGRGFRDLIAAALGAGAPVLTAVSPSYRDAWRSFGDDLARELSCDVSAALAWFDSEAKASAAA